MDRKRIPSFDYIERIVNAHEHQQDAPLYTQKIESTKDTIYKNTASLLKKLIPDTNDTSLITDLGLKDYIDSIDQDISIHKKSLERYSQGIIDVNKLLEESDNKPIDLQKINSAIEEYKGQLLEKYENLPYKDGYEAATYFLQNNERLMTLHESAFPLKNVLLLRTNSKYQQAYQKIQKTLEFYNPAKETDKTIAGIVQSYKGMMDDASKIKDLTSLKNIIENRILTKEERYDNFIEIIAKSLGFNRNSDLDNDFEIDDPAPFSQDSIEQRQNFFKDTYGTDILNRIQFDISKYAMLQKALEIHRESMNNAHINQAEWVIDRLKSSQSYTAIKDQNPGITTPEMAVLYLLFASSDETPQIDSHFAQRVLGIPGEYINSFSQSYDIYAPTDIKPNDHIQNPFSTAGGASSSDTGAISNNSDYGYGGATSSSNSEWSSPSPSGSGGGSSSD